MSNLLIFFGIVIIIMIINSILIQTHLDDETRYKKYKSDIYDQNRVLVIFLFFGVFLLPFKKRLRKWRKKLDLEMRYKGLTENRRFMMFNDPSLMNSDIDKELFALERYFKLRRLQKKVR